MRNRPTDQTIVISGDFNCPWSYLASLRADVLRAAGLHVEWRAVEHAPRRPGRDQPPAVESLRTEVEQVAPMLLPGEMLPHDGVGGSPPATRAATTAYAEARAAGVDASVRRVLFDALWAGGADIGSVTVLRSLLRPLLRGTASPSEAVRVWGYPVDVTGGAISTQAWRLARAWREEWQEITAVVPLLQVTDEPPVVGTEALQWLGEAIRRRHLTPGPAPTAPRALPDRREDPGNSWTSMNGGQWLPRSQALAAAKSVD